MKRLLFIITMMALVGFQAEAQQRGNREKMDPDEMATKMTDRMAEQLDLTEDQKKEVHQLHLDRIKKRMEMREKHKEEMKSRRENMQKERESEKAEMERILTPEQKEKWTEIQKENEQKRRNIRDGRGNPDREKLKKLHEKRQKEGEVDPA